MYCRNCGAKIDDDARFCPNCGVSVSRNSSHAQAAGPQKNSQNQQTFEAQWQNAGAAANGAVENLADRINTFTGGEGHVELKFKDFFAEVFKHHTSEEADEIFACGTKDTTPAPQDISRTWPKPWFYSRVFLTLLVMLLLLYFMMSKMGNPNVIPGLMFVGAMIGPIPILFFYFECNSPRNISMIKVLEMFFVGGTLSIFITLFLDEIFPNGTGNLLLAMMTGVIEELGKAIAIGIFIKKMSEKRYILNGLLIGGAVGAGFAVFETAGYIFNRSFVISGDWLDPQISINTSGMMSTLVTRAILACGGHVAWAAVTGAAMMIALKGSHDFSWGILGTADFLKIFVMNIVLHGLWDTSFGTSELVEDCKDLLLCFIIWVIIMVMLNRGLKEINQITKNNRNELCVEKAR